MEIFAIFLIPRLQFPSYCKFNYMVSTGDIGIGEALIAARKIV